MELLFTKISVLRFVFFTRYNIEKPQETKPGRERKITGKNGRSQDELPMSGCRDQGDFDYLCILISTYDYYRTANFVDENLGRA